MENSELTQNLFEKYGIVIKEDDPAWLLYRVHKDINDGLSALVQNADKTANRLQNNSHGVVDEFKKINNVSSSLISQLSTLQENFDTSISMSERNINETRDGVNQDIALHHSRMSKILREYEKKIVAASSNVNLSELTEKFENELSFFIQNSEKNITRSMDQSQSQIQKSANDFILKSTEINKKINTKATELDRSLVEFNSSFKNISMKIMVAVGVTCLAVGVSAGNILSNYFDTKFLNDNMIELVTENKELEEKAQRHIVYKKYFSKIDDKVYFKFNKYTEYKEIDNHYYIPLLKDL